MIRLGTFISSFRLYLAPFAKGILGENKCLPGYDYITTTDECKRAAAALGNSNWGTSNNLSHRPKGCYYTGSGYYKEISFYFNSHDTGSASTGHQIVCKLGMSFLLILTT